MSALIFCKHYYNDFVHRCFYLTGLLYLYSFCSYLCYLMLNELKLKLKIKLMTPLMMSSVVQVQLESTDLTCQYNSFVHPGGGDEVEELDYLLDGGRAQAPGQLRLLWSYRHLRKKSCSVETSEIAPCREVGLQVGYTIHQTGVFYIFFFFFLGGGCINLFF